MMPIAEYVTTGGRGIPPVARGVVMDATVELTVLTMLTASTEDLDLEVDSLSSFTAVVDGRVVVDVIVVVDDDCVVCWCFVNA